MRLFKRQMNPIFVEDEDYNWGGKRHGGLKLLLLLTVTVLVVGLVMSYAA